MTEDVNPPEQSELFLGPLTSTGIVSASPLDKPHPKESAVVTKAENFFVKQEIERVKPTENMRAIFCYENIQTDDKLIVLYTSMPNSKICEALYDLIKDVEIKYYLHWNVTKN